MKPVVFAFRPVNSPHPYLGSVYYWINSDYSFYRWCVSLEAPVEVSGAGQRNGFGGIARAKASVLHPPHISGYPVVILGRPGALDHVRRNPMFAMPDFHPLGVGELSADLANH